MTKNNFIAILVSVGMIALNTQPFIALAQTATSSTGVAVFSEDFNSTSDFGVPGGWTKTGDWGAVQDGLEFGKVMYGDANNFVYVEQAGSRLTSPTINLSGATSARVSFVTRCDTEYTADTDFMTLQVSGDGSAFSNLTTWNEPTIDTNGDDEVRPVKSMDVEIPSQYLTANAKIAFLWTANAADNDHDGCIIDNVVVTTNGTASGNTGGNNNGGNTGGTATTTDNTGGTATTTPGTGTSTTTPGTGTATTTDNTGGTATTTPGTGAGSGNNGNTNTNVHEITDCASLMDAGATYRLGRNISTTDTCLRVMADNITIDGAGFAIIGDRGIGHYGVRAEQRSGLTVKNLTVKDFEYGIWFTAVDSSTVNNVRLENNSYGFVLHGGDGIEVINSVAHNNDNTGIYLKDATDSMVRGNTASDNEVGINLDSSENNTVKENEARGNDRGILLLMSHDNVVTNNTARDNVFGMVVETVSTRNSVSNIGLYNNFNSVAIGSANNTFTGLHIEGSRGKGIHFFELDSTGNTISNSNFVNTQGGAVDMSFDGENLHPRAGVTGTVFMNTPIAAYFINSPGGTFTYGNSFGSVVFTSPVTGSGANMNEQIKIENSKITIGSSFNSAANISFATSSNLVNTSLLKDGVPCTTCAVGSNTLTFSITGAGVYELRGTVSTSTGNNGGTGTTTDNTGTTTNNTGTTTNNTGTTTNNTGTTTDTTGGTGTTTNNTATTTDTTSTSSDSDDDDNNGSRSRSVTIVRGNGASAGDEDDDVEEIQEIAAIISILESPSITPSLGGSGTTIIGGTGGADTSTNFSSGASVGSTEVVDEDLTGTGGPDDVLAQDFGTTSETAAVSDAFDDENPNRMRNLGIGALILLIVIAIIFGISRRA